MSQRKGTLQFCFASIISVIKTQTFQTVKGNADNIFLSEKNHTTKQILHYFPNFKIETYEHACVYMCMYVNAYMRVCAHMHVWGNSHGKAGKT